MTITSKPATDEYREGWDRIFSQKKTSRVFIGEREYGSVSEALKDAQPRDKIIVLPSL